MSEEKVHVIMSPHPDDDVIGCYEVLLKEKKVIVIYTEDIPQIRREESLELKKHFDNIGGQLFLRSVPPNLLNKESVLYYPDPIYDVHPSHRKVGAQGEELLRRGLNVVFYNTCMNAPYIHEVELPEQKEQVLEKVYSSQKSLWKYEKKYFLFEGRCKWLI